MTSMQTSIFGGDDDDEDTTGADRGDAVGAAVAGEDDPGTAEDDTPDADVDPDADPDADPVPAAQRRDATGRFAKDVDDDDTDADDPDPVPNAAVRLDRMREQRDRERAAREDAERRLAALEMASKPAEPAVDPLKVLDGEIDSLYEQVEEARLDGDAKLAAQLQRQLDTKKEERIEFKTERVVSRSTVEASENARYDALLDQLESEISVINPRHDDFDPEAVKALEFYVAAHEKMGMSATRALIAARNVVFGAARAPVQDDAPPAKAGNPPVKKTDLGKVADTQRRQPPDVANKGSDKDDITIDPDKLSDEEWDKLPKSKRAAMRGDHG